MAIPMVKMCFALHIYANGYFSDETASMPYRSDETYKPQTIPNRWWKIYDKTIFAVRTIVNWKYANESGYCVAIKILLRNKTHSSSVSNENKIVKHALMRRIKVKFNSNENSARRGESERNE